MSTTTTSSTVTKERRSSGGGLHQAKVHPKQIIITRRSTHGGPGSGVGMSSQRHSMSSGMGMGMAGGMGMSMGAGVAGNIAHKGVDDMKSKRFVEKRDLQDLNDRLANYISQVRSLEAENKALREALKKKRKDFDPEHMKELYQNEIDESKKLLDAAQKENAELKVHISSLQDELEDQQSVERLNEERIDHLQDKVNSLNDENAHRTSECDMLRRKVEELEKQVAHWKAKYQEVYSQLQAARADLKDETNQRIAETTRAETLQEELDFLRSITDAEIREYKAMLTKEDDSGTNIREAWNDEFAKHIQELRNEYEQRIDDISQEMSSRYESQLIQIRESHAKTEPAAAAVVSTESRKIRSESNQKDLRIKELEGQLDRFKMEIRSLNNQLERVTQDLDSEKEMHSVEVKKLHDEMEAMINELQMLMDAKMSLELEIAAYRKLLEGGESRLSMMSFAEMAGGFRGEGGDALANILQSSGGGGGGGGGGSGGGMGGGSGGGMGGGMSSGFDIDAGRITMQRSSKSVLSIAEVDSNGRFVIIENTSQFRSKTKVNLRGWKLNRKFPGSSFNTEVSLDYVFSKDCDLDGEQSVRIWAKNYEKEADLKRGDIISTIDDWGQVNRNSVLTLFDEKDAVKATMSINANF